MAIFDSHTNWSEEESSVESLVRLESPDATTISSHSYPSTDSLKANDKLGEGNGHVEFVALQRELARFVSKNRTHRTNVMRLSLLPFLRRRSCEILPVDQEVHFRVIVLESWWLQLLEDLRTNIVSGADRAAYYETISGLISRPEWCSDPYHHLLKATLDIVMPKIALPNLAPGLASFAGKLFAYCYYTIPGIADCLLYDLRLQQSSVDRLKAHVPRTFTGSVPSHLKHLICRTEVLARPKSIFRADCSSWVRNWFPDSPIFVSFLKHYYTLLAESLPSDYVQDSHFGAPGLILIHAAILQYLDAFVERRPEQIQQKSQSMPSLPVAAVSGVVSPIVSPAGSPVGSPAASPAVSPLTSPDSSPNGSPPSSPKVRMSMSPPRRRVNVPRVDKLRLFCALREIIHNDECTVPFYQSFCLQFDRLIQAVACSVNVYTMNSCVKLCDLVEEWLSCVVIEHRKSLHQVTAMLSKAVDWEFWIHVASRMLSSENCHSEIRAISLLFNIWPHIPHHKISDPGTLSRTPRPRRDTVFYPQSPMLLWDFTQWLLSPQIWQAYFCHWSPLVRSYYLRLLCYRVVSVGSNASEWIADYTQSNYHTQGSALVKQRLVETWLKCEKLTHSSDMDPCTLPSLPLPNRQVTIGINAAAAQQDAHHIYMFDIFDNSAYYADQRTIVMSDSGSSCSRDSDTASLASVASTASVDLMRRSSSLVSMGLIRRERTPSNRLSLPPTPSPKKPNKSASETKLAATASPKKWGLFRKLLPSNNNVEEEPKQTRIKRKNFRFADPNNIPTPWQLSEPCPEIQRPLYRFQFCPTHESKQREGLSRPFLPFEEELELCGEELASTSDLSLWNYGCRGLAEWNETVTAFEQFVEHKLGFQASDKLAMPFMVAEIPWRAIG